MAPDHQLEAAIEKVESRLMALGDALRAHRAETVEAEAAELQRALAAAIEPLRRGAAAQALPPQLRQRLALAGAHVGAQREALARASAAAGRAIDVLLPGPAPHVAYSAAGLSQRRPQGGLLRA